MSAKKITLTEDDLRCCRMRTAKKTVELFGEDYLNDFGIEVPPEFVAEYEAVMQQYWEMQKKLYKLFYAQSKMEE